MTEAVLKFKVSVTEALYKFCYSHITISDDGRGITVEDLTDNEARRLIRENNLEANNKDEVDYHIGKVYHDGKFKDFINSHPFVKKNLLTIIDKIN